LSVRAGESGDGQWIASDTRAYTVTEQGMHGVSREAYGGQA